MNNNIYQLHLPPNPVFTFPNTTMSSMTSEIVPPNNIFANSEIPMYVPIGKPLSTFNVSSLNASVVNANLMNATNASILDLSAAIAFVSSLTTNQFTCNNSSIIEALEVSTINSKAIATSSIYGVSGEISTFRTNRIVWGEDNIVMEAQEIPGPAYELILNGQVVVTTSTLTSSIAEWAQFPAVSTIQMTGNGIVDCNSINMADLTTPGIFGTISSVGNIIGSGTGISRGFISNIATNVLGSTMATSSLTGANISSAVITGGAATTSTITAGRGFIGNLSTGAIAVPNISTNNLTVGTINSFTGSSIAITAQTNLSQNADNIFLTADEGALISAEADVTLTAQNGNRGRVNLVANPGFNNGVGGEVNITANAGSVLGVGTGGLVNITANSPLVVSSFTSAIKLSAAGINSYAGAIPSIGSLAGYNFIYGTLGINLCVTQPSVLPNVPTTLFMYAPSGVTSGSDFYCPNIYPYWNGLTTPPDMMIAGRYIVPNLATVMVRLSTIRSMEMAGSGAISGVRTFSGSNIAMTNISSINGAVYPPPISFISSFVNLSTQNIQLSSINGAAYPPPAGSASTFSTITASTLFARNATVSSFSVSSINGAAYPPAAGAISTYSTLAASSFTNTIGSISTLSLSSINNMAQFGTKSMIINGDVAQLQLANNAGQFTKLNLLARQNYSEIQSFDSTFTVPLNLIFKADNFGFNQPNIVGGFEMDISGNTLIENGFLAVGAGAVSTIIEPADITTTQINTSSILMSDNDLQYHSFRQPAIFYGKVSSLTGGSGSTSVTLPVSYANSSFVVQATMEDIDPAQMSANITGTNTFDIYWGNAGGGTHTIGWTTFGDLT